MAQAQGMETEKAGMPATTWAVVLLTLLIELLFAGLPCGFSSFQILLEADGVFSGECEASDPTCGARTDKFVLLWTVVMVSMCSFGMPVGFAVDFVGPIWGTILGGLFQSTGLVLHGFAAPDSVALFVLGQVFIALGAMFFLFISLPLVFVLPAKLLPMVMSLSSNLFDASAVMYLVLYQIYEMTGLSRKELFLGYAVVCLVCSLALAFAWLLGPLKTLRAVQDAEKKHAEVGSSADKSGDVSGSACAAAALPPLHGMSVVAQLRSFEFAFCVSFFCINVFISNSYLGLNKTVLEGLGDADTGYLYTRIFGSVMPVSCFAAPVVGKLLQRKGFVWGYGVIVLLCGIFQGVMLIPVLPVHVVAFLAYSFYRAFFYSVHWSFVGHSFGSRTSSTIGGLVAFVGAFGQLGMYVGSKLVNEYGQGRFVIYYFLPIFLFFTPFALASVRRLYTHLQYVPLGDCKAQRDPPANVSVSGHVVDDVHENAESSI